ncbi:putative mitogen-activated protein kinase kinase kinase 4, partial [Apostichopus japonicus]
CGSSASLATQDPWEADIRADDSLSIYGTWHPDFIKMELPSYLPIFLFLIRIPVDVMHECLRFRLEHKPTAEPSLHSVQQLLNECKEVLRAAAQVKGYYQKMVFSLVKDSAGTLEHMDSDIDDYENNLEAMLQHYFEYLHSWMQMLQKLPQASVSLKNILEVEWHFAKEACPSIRGGEAQAGKRFCIMASSLFESISEFLENDLDIICNQFQDSQLLDDSNVEKQSRRNLRKLVIEIRDRLSKALSFSKMFIRDLEIAAEFQCTGSEDCLLAALHNSGHVRVKTVELPAHWVFVPGSIKASSEVIHSLLDDLCSHEGRVDSPQAAISDGYILLMKAPENREKWIGEEIEVILNVEVTIQLSDIQVNSILLVVNHSSLLLDQRRIFKKAVGDVINLVNENTSSHATIAQTLQQLKSNALNMCSGVTKAISRAEQNCVPLDGSHVVMKDTLDLFYSVGFEYHKEVERLLSGNEKSRHAECILVLAEQWITYKVASLEDDEYQTLKNKISTCINHVIGGPDSRPASPTEVTAEFGRPSRSISKSSRTSECSLSPVPTKENLSRTNSTDLEKLQFGQFLQPIPVTPDCSPKCTKLNIKSGRRCRNIQAKLQEMERKRNQKLREKKHIGVVREDTAPSPVISISCKKVTFKWQRGFKIGEGQFGTVVYSCINMDTGETLAVKEIRFQRNDQSVIKNIADEIHYLEGISHPNLVRYYGVELHREEMLVFMEYCDEGTIAEAAKNGLPEGLIRQYTKEICTAISVLHQNNIIHRDIKGANIFLHSDGHVKLGDFGAAIKLKKHQTLLGEVNDVMGTVAFMAPEIIINSTEDGYGRAADIWSLGCVVIEMASGKRPWHEFDNNFAIMYRVGGGGIPRISENHLNKEGHDFLSRCLQQNAKDRSTANELLEHQFLKVTGVFSL